MKKIYILFLFIFFNSFGQDKKDNISFQDYILVDVDLKGNNYKFLFDTGSFISVFFDVNNSIQKDKSHLIIVHDGYDKTDTMFFPKNKIKYILPKFNIRVSGDGIAISKKIPDAFKKANVYGIIGNDLVSKFDWVYTPSKNRLEQYNKTVEIDTLDYFSFKIDKKNITSCKVTTDKQCVFNDKYLLDTGYLGILNHSKINCFNDYLTKTKQFASLAQTKIENIKIIKSNVELGNFLSVNVPIDIWDTADSSNLIGINFLRAFDEVIFLFSQNKVLLKKKPIYTFKMSSPTVSDHKIFDYLENPLSTGPQFKKWIINSEVNLKENDFDIVEYLVKFSEKTNCFSLLNKP